MNVIIELERHGYTFTLSGETIRATCETTPDPATVQPLLAELKRRKTEALAFLRQRELQTHVSELPDVTRLDADSFYRADDGNRIEPCYYYDAHRASFWLAPGQRYICGVCHPSVGDDVKMLNLLGDLPGPDDWRRGPGQVNQ